MEENEYIGYIEGFIASTDVDAHGDKLTPEALESLAKQIESNPELRVMPFNHDRTQPMGYITDIRVETKGQWKGIKITAGVYRTRPDLWQKVLSGEISGFSYGATVLEWEDKGMTNELRSFSVEVEPSTWHEVSNMLSKMGAILTADVRKSIDIPTMIGVSISVLSLPGSIYSLYSLWQKRNKGTQGDKCYLRIKTTKRTYSFEEYTVEEIVQEIEADVSCRTKNK